ncbi:MAG: hypothetical protein U9N35_05005 [Euryarchaeota archaeon]|nr:hypothetical protein [Euryarchaeota archaeon]
MNLKAFIVVSLFVVASLCISQPQETTVPEPTEPQHFNILSFKQNHEDLDSADGYNTRA